MASVAPAIVSSQLAGAGRTTPLPVSTVRDAYSSRATKAVHGYFDRRAGELHFEFSIEDLRTHRMDEPVSLDGDILSVAKSLARSFDPSARDFATSNVEALEAWGKGDFDRAVRLDPGFSTAWMAWTQALAAAGQTQQALATANQALAQSLHSPIDRVQLQVLQATLRGDDGARDQALIELVRLMPNDATLARTLAERFLNGRRYESAVRLFREVIRLDPSEASAYNLLGYALFFDGDVEGAIAALEQYAKQPGQEANSLDSQGEVTFMAGRFREAESYFLQAHEKDPALVNGSDLLKAAYARWLADDLDAADKTFASYLQYRKERGDPSVEWRRSVWLYATGRQPEAVSVLRAVRGPAAQVAQQQLAVWERTDALHRDAQALRPVYERTPPTADGLVRTLYARALHQAGKLEEARELVRWYPLPESGEASLQSLLFPMYLELRRELLP